MKNKQILKILFIGQSEKYEVLRRGTEKKAFFEFHF